MKILYCIDHLRPDGTQRVLSELIAGLAQHGHGQAVLCLNNSVDDTLLDDLRKLADVRVVGKAALGLGYGLISAWRWLRHEQFDVVVTLLFAADVIGRTLAHTAGVPRIVSSLRARNTNYARWQRWLVRLTMRWADCVILNSRFMRDFALAEEGASPERIVVIPNGVAASDYQQSLTSVAVRQEFGLALGALTIGTVGRLTFQKGFDVLLEALARLPHQDVQLVVIGTGEAEVALRAQTIALGLTERVCFAGYRHDVPRLLGAFDLYVQPSRFEGMPNAVLEAMAAGCPIVASAVDGIQELIEDGQEGWLAPPEDVKALVDAIDAALTGRDEARRRAIKAQQRVASDFSLDAMVSKWEKALAGYNE